MTASVAGQWEGTIHGTNVGRIFATIEQSGSDLSATLNINDYGIGAHAFAGSGTIEGVSVALHLHPKNTTPGVRAGPVDVRAELGTDGAMRGSWKSTVGTAGAFQLQRLMDQAPGQMKLQLPATPKISGAFVMMSMRPDDPQLDDVLDAIKRACKSCGLPATRVDEVEHSGRITDVIRAAIRDHQLLVCDVTDPRPNVCYELGFAHGLGREVILLAKSGADLPFDFKDYNVIFYKNLGDLQERLERRLSTAKSAG